MTPIEERAWLGAVLLASPADRGAILDQVADDDPADLTVQHALGMVRKVVAGGAADLADIGEQWATLAAQAKAWPAPKFNEGPRTWLAGALSDGVKVTSPRFLAGQLAGAGRRRAAIDAARRIAAAGELADPGDFTAVLTEQLEHLEAAVGDGPPGPADSLPARIRAHPFLTLTERLGRPQQEIRYRIDGLLPAGGNVVLSAQWKAGKTTAVDNLVRSLVDGGPFLAPDFTVNGAGLRVTLVDNEMPDQTIDDWLRALGIRNTDAVRVASLRGSEDLFNLLDPAARQTWVDLLRDHGTDVLVLDCLRPVMDALGLNVNYETGRFLTAFNATLKAAGVTEAVIAHHMGHNGERSLGDSRLRGWPDAEWRLIRPAADDGTDDPSSARYFTAYGRGVNVAEGRLDYEAASRTLTYRLGDRQGAIVDLVADHLAAAGPSSKNSIEKGIRGNVQAVRAAISKGMREGRFTAEKGPRGAQIIALANPQLT